MAKFRRTLSASSLSSDKVINDQGETLGDVKDIMIDVIDGHVAYVVLSFGGFLGLGDKLFAVPFSKMTVDEDKKAFVLNVPKEKLEKAPGFDKDHWPDVNDTTWLTDVFSYYEAKPYWHEDSKF